MSLRPTQCAQRNIMPIRGIVRQASTPGLATGKNAPFFVDSDDNIPYINPAGTGTDVVPFVLGLAGVTGAKIAAGSGVLVSGIATVATGLTTVKGFSAAVRGATGFATGATEVHEIQIVSITTGAVAVQGVFNAFVTGAATISVSGTATFNWVAIGT
mgnify:CR=1 FL=1